MIAKAPKILVVEDELKMLELLDQALTESSYQVTVAEDGYQGLDLAQGQDLIILDLMMPKLNGFEFLRQLRSQGLLAPVLVISARDGLEDRVKGLDLGADDYLVKPFKLQELLARIRAMLRRARLSDSILQYSDVWLDCRSRKVKRGENSIHLSSTEFAILELLMLQPHVVVSRQAILREVWNEAMPREGNVVEVYLTYLRAKLETRGMPRIIHTVRGQGYILQDREVKS